MEDEAGPAIPPCWIPDTPKRMAPPLVLPSFVSFLCPTQDDETALPSPYQIQAHSTLTTTRCAECWASATRDGR
jgi:hypothetical protein